MNHILEFDSIRLSFGERVILSDVYMKCETGKITGLLGRNGQGKSCLFNIIYGELAAEERSIRFDKLSFGQAYKRPDLLLFLPQFSFIPKAFAIGRVFDDFDLDYQELEKRFPEFRSKHRQQFKNLSGGESRFIQTYIVLKAKSQFAILDEPFTHLMPLQIEKMAELIKEEKQYKGLLITDHIYRIIVDLADDLYLLTGGKTHRVTALTDIEDLGYAIAIP
ncbi:MAG TPA: ATP-binding cassette domain-containing protein [Mucilaginibacter sp.]|nr:ATP-binding cassette domain-containing protein [Mucilaginibacter sp.]